MKARHGVLLLIASQILTILGKFFNAADVYRTAIIWDISSVCWTLGLLIVLIKVLNSEKLKGFLEE